MIARRLINPRLLLSRQAYAIGLTVQARTLKSMKIRPEIPMRPKLSHEETERLSQGNISDFDIFQDLPTPLNTIEVVLSNGFRLKSGAHFRCTDPVNHPKALVLLSTETFTLDLGKSDKGLADPTSAESKIPTADDPIKGLDTGFVEIHHSALEFLEVVHPKPEMLVVGLGKRSRMLHPNTRKYLTGLGMQIELSTTTIAANNFDLLTTERPGQVGALLLAPNV
ncbi:uncharacterized protein SAPINGB_P002209 [Magnusiomyces paraingens]|uniref:NADH dehydrogenase [ubiquinone] 1 alpha subcomplex assembly factor 3 n=1 Tax=Magnusiomyces paraingens TaxID=2606893 RepID=A0A5E8BE41_9ASCO|nr:uncharacterized protein SAPINGB_P002209 [Saprochaete ingens]VVT49314.1 unnamed protein product [Saprochaete ingens]